MVKEKVKSIPAYKNRSRRTVKLTEDEMDALKVYIKTFDIQAMAADSLGITRQTLSRILDLGVCSGSNAEIIKEKIKSYGGRP